MRSHFAASATATLRCERRPQRPRNGATDMELNGHALERQHLAALFAEDDRLRAETEQFLADRRAKASPPARGTEEVATSELGHDANAPYAAPQGETMCFDEDGQPFMLCFS